MAIAYDSSAVSADGAITWSHTCSGSNIILIVIYDSLFASSTAASYNSVSMTLLTSVTTPYTYRDTYYLLNPETGAHTVSITNSITGLGIGLSVSYTGALQSGQPDSYNSGYNTSSNVTVSTTVVNTNCWLVVFGHSFGTTSSTAGRTSRQNTPYYSNSHSACIEDSNGVVSTGSVSTTIAGSLTYERAGTVISIQPALTTNNGDFFAFF